MTDEDKDLLQILLVEDSIDQAVLARVSHEFGKKQAALEQEINQIAGAQVNPGSPKQLGDILFG